MKVRIPVKVADGIVGRFISCVSRLSLDLLRLLYNGEYHSLAFLAPFLGDTPLMNMERNAVRETMMTALHASICSQKRIQVVSQVVSERIPALLIEAMTAMDKFRHRKTPNPIF